MNSEVEEKLKKMIWDFNWSCSENEKEHQSDSDKIRELFEYATNNGLTNKIEFLRLNIQDFRILKREYPEILKKALVTIFMEDIKDISLSELEELKKYYNIQYLQISSLHHYENKSSMSLQIIYKYKKTIMKIVKDIDENFLKDNPHREKIIFGIVLPRIIERTRYDENAQIEYEEKHNKTMSRRIVFDKKLHNNPSNPMVGLFKGGCVCRGYAGIVRDVFNELGIDVNVITGFNNNNYQMGHAWNQIKLDGQWYNMDLTWDLKYISCIGKSYWLLKNDDDFEKGITIQNGDNTSLEAHCFYSTNRSPSVCCDKSLSIEDLNKYIDIEKIRKKLWLTRFLTKIEEKTKVKVG